MTDDKMAVARSQSIDQQLDEAREQKMREMQLVILGPQGAGKSTFTKQLRMLHGDGFPAEERKKFIGAITDNAAEALYRLLQNLARFDLKVCDPDRKKTADFICSYFEKMAAQGVLGLGHSPLLQRSSSGASSTGASTDKDTCPSLPQLSSLPAVASHFDPKQLFLLWKSEPVQKCYRKKEELELVPAETHFLEHLDRISNDMYTPTPQDILYARKPTVGIEEYTFSVDTFTCRVVDVAGQRSQRKKWLHHFDSCTAVLFFASLSTFCETVITEDKKSINALTDTLCVYEELINSPYLNRSDFVLFLNKKDILAMKLRRHKLGLCMPSYKGDNTIHNAVNYFKSEFEAKTPEGRNVYTHACVATDTTTMKPILEKVEKVVVEINMRRLKTI